MRISPVWVVSLHERNDAMGLTLEANNLWKKDSWNGSHKTLISWTSHWNWFTLKKLALYSLAINAWPNGYLYYTLFTFGLPFVANLYCIRSLKMYSAQLRLSSQYSKIFTASQTDSCFGNFFAFRFAFLSPRCLPRKKHRNILNLLDYFSMSLTPCWSAWAKKENFLQMNRDDEWMPPSYLNFRKIRLWKRNKRLRVQCFTFFFCFVCNYAYVVC